MSVDLYAQDRWLQEALGYPFKGGIQNFGTLPLLKKASAFTSKQPCCCFLYLLHLQWTARSQPIRLSVISSWPLGPDVSSSLAHVPPFPCTYFWLGFVLCFHSCLPPLACLNLCSASSPQQKCTFELVLQDRSFLHVWDLWSLNPVLPGHMTDLKPSPSRQAFGSHNKTWTWRNEFESQRKEIGGAELQRIMIIPERWLLMGVESQAVPGYLR